MISVVPKKLQWDAMVRDAIANIEKHGGNEVDAQIIIGNFGMVGDFMPDMLNRIKGGKATTSDAMILKEKLSFR